MPRLTAPSFQGHPSSTEGGRLFDAFRRIHRERMRGLPILNPRLEVAVLDGGILGEDWLGVLLTPWCMSLVALPVGTDAVGWTAGGVRTLKLPAGEVELALSSEPDLGPYATCPLFSPMGDFPDQASALATARAVVEALFLPESATEAALSDSLEGPRGLSRRDLLRGWRRSA